MEEPESLIASLAICEAKRQQCLFLDIKDWKGFRDILTKGFRLDVHGNGDVFTIEGRDAAISKIRSRIANAMTIHTLSGAHIWHDGNHVDAIFKIKLTMIFNHPGPVISASGDFSERWIRQGREWKIARVKLMHWCTQVQSYPPAATAVH